MRRIDPAALSRKNLALLIVFDVVAEMRSVTLAAERLSLSQPALSHSVGKLRQLFDDPLFVRGRGRARGWLVLTPRAEALVAPVHALLARAETILCSVRREPVLLEGDLRLAMADSCRLTLGDAVVRHVQEVAPGVRLHVERMAEDSNARLGAGTLDLVLGQDMVVPRGLRAMEVQRDRLIGVVHGAHPLAVAARANVVTFDDWLACPHVVVAVPGCIPDYIDAALAPLGVGRRVGARAASFLQALSSLPGSMLVAAVPARLFKAARPMLPDLVAFDLPVKTAPVRQHLVWHPSTGGDPLHGWLRETVRAVARNGEAADIALPSATPVPSVTTLPTATSWPLAATAEGAAGDPLHV